MQNQFYSIVEKFKNKRILVVGEAFLDSYLFGIAERISREAPIPIVDLVKRENVPGGAANTARNLSALGANVFFLSVIGNDPDGEVLRLALQQSGVDTTYIFSDATRQTMTKKRILANQQIVLRFDEGTVVPLSETTEKHFLDKFIHLWVETEAVVISDYGYGILTDSVITTLEKLQQMMPHVLAIDSKYLDKYKQVSATVVKPNYKEAMSLLGLTKSELGENRIYQIMQNKDLLYERTNAHFTAVTLDTEGALIFDKNGHTYRTYADVVDYPQVAGAGDTYTAGLSLALACEADIKTASEIAAAAAKVIIRKKGTATCTFEELLATFASSEKFVRNLPELKKLVSAYKYQGKKLVFSNGCFDILHSGHVMYLSRAKSFGDVLILGVNTDESIRLIKGEGRPINTLIDRMQVLSALSCIDHIVPMKDKTACNLVRIVRPDMYVKGGDYTQDILPEAQIVEEFGGKVQLIPIVKGKSTTRIIHRIQQTKKQNPLM